jgi:hypothetical protein
LAAPSEQQEKQLQKQAAWQGIIHAQARRLKTKRFRRVCNKIKVGLPVHISPSEQQYFIFLNINYNKL